MCGCNKNKGGCVGSNCPPDEQQIMGKTTLRMDLSPMSKDSTRDYAITDLVRVELMTVGPNRAVYGLVTKRLLGRYTTGNLFLMPRVDYDEAIRQGKTSYRLESEGFDPTVLPGIGSQMAERLRFEMNVFSKEDLINLGIDGLTKLHPTITEDKAREILDILLGKMEVKVTKAKKASKEALVPA